MQKPIYAGKKANQKPKRWLKIFIVILCIQFLVLIYFYIFKDSSESIVSEKQIIQEEKIISSNIKNVYTIDDEKLDEIHSAINNNKANEAYNLIQPLLKYNSEKVYDLLGKINMMRLKSYDLILNKRWYVVKSGDALWKIARSHNTTINLIKILNNKETDNIRVGERLLVFQGINKQGQNSFSIKVSKDQNTLDLMINNELFKRYIVGTGKFGKTPEVKFFVYDKIIEPPWTRPNDNKIIEYGDPENVLGTRWMALHSPKNPDLTGYGIHGTWERDSIGYQSSDGCIRMYNEDVEELFNLIPRKTLVHVIN